MKKRLMAVLMVGVMVGSLFTGCSKSTDKNSNTSATTGTPSASENTGEERMTLELWTTNRDAANNQDAWYVKKIEDEFNVDIVLKVRNEGGTDYSDWLTLTLSGKDAPDWFRDQAIGITMLNDYVKQGLVAELDPEMVKENMPNYMAYVSKYSHIFGDDPLSLYAVDGKAYSIPDAKVDLSQFCLMAYRQDWLDKLGLKAPETLDDFTEVMKAFTFNDPDGNGANDTYGYIGITGSSDWAFSPIFAAFGTYPGLWYAKEDGTVTRGEIEPGTKEALKYIKSLYDMGVIDPEWMTIDFEQAKDKMVSSVDGASWQNWDSILNPTGWWSTLKDTVPDASWAVTSGVAGPNGDKGVMQFNPLAGVGLVFSKHMEKEPEKLAKYLQVFDAIAGDPAWYEAEIWGQEGETFTKDTNGERQYTEAYSTEEARTKFGIGTVYRFPSLEIFEYEPEVHDPITFSKEVYDIRKGTLDIAKGKYNILGTFNLPTFSDVSADLPDMNVVFTEMITGERDIEEFDTVVQEWMDKGGKESIEEAQKVYDERFK